MIRGILVSAIALAIPAVLFTGIDGPASALFSQYIGSGALIAMALSQIISTRAWFAEPIFGPLDRSYIIHKWLGIGALLAIFLHENIDAEIRALGKGTALNDFAEGLGEQSLNLLMILVGITLITLIPYRLWYWTHRAMGLGFALGAAHYAMIKKPFANTDLLGIYILTFCALGVISYIYTLLPRHMRFKRSYTVTHIEQTGQASAITLTPNGRAMRHQPGQFAFFSFQKDRKREVHPFTISSAPNQDGQLRVSIAALGDFTKRAPNAFTVGTEVKLQGPFGHFTPAAKTKKQVWVAGGIGITPFLAWLDALDQKGGEIDLIYCFKNRDSAAHLSEVEDKASKNPRVKLHLFDGSAGQRVTRDYVQNCVQDKSTKLAFCGPSGLRNDLKGLVHARNFHYEAFEIRTGLQVLDWAMAKLKTSAIKVFQKQFSQRVR